MKWSFLFQVSESITGRTKDGLAFPVSVSLRKAKGESCAILKTAVS